VRSTRTPTGACRHISDFASGWLQTKVLVVSSTSRLGIGHRWGTPIGAEIRDLSIEQVRAMYQQATTRLLNEVAETEQFFRAGILAIDITEADPFTGDRTGHEDEIIGTKETTDEYAYQWATVQLVGNAVPIVLDAPRPKGETRLEIVEDLLDSAEDLVHVDNVLMDREFDSQHVLEMISQRGLSYVVPKRMQTSEKAQAKRLLQRDQDRYETNRKLHLGKNEWHETTLIYRRKEDSDHDDHRQYSVFMTNCGSGHLTEYGYRWRLRAATSRSNGSWPPRPRRILDCDSFTSRSHAYCTQSGERSIYSYRSN